MTFGRIFLPASTGVLIPDEIKGHTVRDKETSHPDFRQGTFAKPYPYRRKEGIFTDILGNQQTITIFAIEGVPHHTAMWRTHHTVMWCTHHTVMWRTHHTAMWRTHHTVMWCTHHTVMWWVRHINQGHS